MKPLRHAATPRRASLPGSAAELCDRKGARVVAKAGTATVKDQEAATVEKEAVLSEKILHECRVFFNDFGADRTVWKSTRPRSRRGVVFVAAS